MFLGLNLAIDPISIGLFKQVNFCEDNGSFLQGKIADIALNTGHDFSENLITHIADFCEKNQCGLADIKAVGVAQGPGSYTGLRIAVTLGKTLAQIKDIPLFGFSTLEAIIFNYRFFNGTYFSVIPACQKEVNLALFGVDNQNITRLTPDFALSENLLVDKLKQVKDSVYVVGNVPESIKPILINLIQETQGKIQLVNPSILYGSTLALMAAKQINLGLTGDYKTVFPLYSHQPNIIKKT